MSKMIKTRKELCIDIYNDVHRSILEIEVEANLINRSLIMTKEPELYENLRKKMLHLQQATKDKRIALVELEEMIKNVEPKKK